MPIRPVRRPSRKPRLRSASARSICDRRPDESRARTTLMTRRVLQPFWVLLAVIFLIEAWLWDHLEPIVARVVALIPLRAFKQWLAERVDTLSPAMTLIVFIVPVIPLFPLKLVGFWLLTHEYWLSAIATIIFAKFLGRSEEHTSELQSHSDLVCRLLLEKKKKRDPCTIEQRTY